MNTDLLVIYTDQLDACKAFYTRLGLTFAEERHGTGPKHYAATLAHGTVLELYPTSPKRPATGSFRLGLTTPPTADGLYNRPSQHTLTDPDGRTVRLTIQE